LYELRTCLIIKKDLSLDKNILFKLLEINIMTNAIPYDMSYAIGNNLRELPNNIEEYEKGIQYLDEQLEQLSEPEEKARCLSMLGVFNRVAGKLEVSLGQLEAADALFAEDGNALLKLVNQLRIAQTLQFQGQYQKAEKIYDYLEECIKTYPEYSPILDFVYQHKGKNYYEQGQLQKALDSIEAALRIRLEKEQQDLIDSSQFAIDIIKETINKV